jgi:recombination protein RecR
MNPIDRLSEIFSHFPGIGPRQARRFVYYLLSRDQTTLDTLVRSVEDLKRETSQCNECMRFFNGTGSLCSICADTSRDRSLLMIVPRDADLDQMEKSGSFKGRYFVLGGSLPILEKEPERRIRIRELLTKLAREQSTLREIILAMNANAEGENTEDYLRQALRKGDTFAESGDNSPASSLTITALGRGLSTGSELEYADPETLKNALLHRTK